MTVTEARKMANRPQVGSWPACKTARSRRSWIETLPIEVRSIQTWLIEARSIEAWLIEAASIIARNKR